MKPERASGKQLCEMGKRQPREESSINDGRRCFEGQKNWEKGVS